MYYYLYVTLLSSVEMNVLLRFSFSLCVCSFVAFGPFARTRVT
jgi:hypothetical protein